MSLHKDKLADMQRYPDKLKRLIKRRFKIDLDNNKTGLDGRPLKNMSEHDEEIIDFSFTVFNAQQLRINELKSASLQFLTSFTELQKATQE